MKFRKLNFEIIKKKKMLVEGSFEVVGRVVELSAGRQGITIREKCY